MTRIVTADLAMLTALAGVAAVGLAVGVAPVWGLVVSVGMLGLLSMALFSPQGPEVRFDNPYEGP